MKSSQRISPWNIAAATLVVGLCAVRVGWSLGAERSDDPLLGPAASANLGSSIHRNKKCSSSGYCVPTQVTNLCLQYSTTTSGGIDVVMCIDVPLAQS